MLALVNSTVPKRLTMRPDHLDYHFQTALECFAYSLECSIFVTDFVTGQLVAVVDFAVNFLVVAAENLRLNFEKKRVD